MNKVSFSVHSFRPRFTGSEWVDSHSIHSSLGTNDMAHHVRHNPTKDSTAQKYSAEKIKIFLNVPGIDSSTLASMSDGFSSKP